MPPVTVKAKTATKSRQRKRAERKAEYLTFKDVDRAAEVAFYYGFTPLPAPLSATKEDRELARALAEIDAREVPHENALIPFIEQKVVLLRLCLEKGLADGALPVLLYGEESLAGAVLRKDTAPVTRVFLDIIGSGKSIAEALLLKTAWTTLQEEGYKNLLLSINSVGDKESLLKFIRELSGYYRRNISLLPPQCRAALRRDPLRALSCMHEKCRPLKADAPKAMEFLSEASRIHFKEVLEYLEALEIPYRLDHCLVGGRTFTGETLFEIWSIPNAKDVSAGERVCFGFRYNNGAKRVGFKRDMPAVGAVLLLSRPTKKRKGGRGIRVRKPHFFFLQLGFDAKLQCLKVVEALRLAGIPLHQALARDKLSTQLATAENLKIPYSLIMGQKEALEGSVIVRNNGTRAQETVKVSELPGHLKKLKLA